MLNLTEKNFEEEIKKAKKPVLVDFWLETCLPCQLIFSILEELSNHFEKEIIFAKVNLNESPIVGLRYGVEVVPTLILFKDGKPISRLIGLREKEEIKKWLEENLKN